MNKYLNFEIFPLSVIPVAILSWYYGSWPGILGAIIITIINQVLLYSSTGYTVFVFNSTNFLSGTTSVIIVSIIVGVSKGIYEKLQENIFNLKKTKNQLVTAHEKLEEVYRIIPSGVFTVNKDKEITDWNHRAEEITGYSKDEVLGKKCTVISSSWDCKSCFLFPENKDKGSRVAFGEEYTYTKKDGSKGVILKNSVLLRNEKGELIGGVESFEDITERKRLERDLRASLTRTNILYKISRSLISNQNLYKILKVVTGGVIEALDVDYVKLVIIDYENRKITNVITEGLYKKDIEENSFDDFWQGVGGQALRENRTLLITDQKIDGTKIVAPLSFHDEYLGTLTAVKRNKFTELGRDEVDLLAAIANQAAGAIENARLFEILKRNERKLRKQATIDHLTGVINRRTGLFFLENQIKTARRNKSNFTISFIDVNNLKEVNDNYGHNEGDNLLIELCKLLKETIRENDILARLGGDEFLLIFPKCELNEAQAVWKRIQKKISDYNDQERKKYNISVSYGLAEYDPEMDPTVNELIVIADKEMYKDKQKYKSARK